MPEKLQTYSTVSRNFSVHNLLRWTLPAPWATERLGLTHCLFTTPGLVLSHLNSIAKPLNHKFFPSGTTVDVLHIIGSGLEVACCIVRLRDEDVVLCAIINRLIQGDWRTLK